MPLFLTLYNTEMTEVYFFNVGLPKRDLFGYVIYSVLLIKYLILQSRRINSNLTMDGAGWGDETRNNSAGTRIIKPFKSFKSNENC